METIYIGVDFHARQQTICYLKTETGELVTCELKHQDKEAVRVFYEQFAGPVIVGLEASGYSPWFERLLEELGCEVWLGHATEIRRQTEKPGSGLRFLRFGNLIVRVAARGLHCFSRRWSSGINFRSCRRHYDEQ